MSGTNRPNKPELTDDEKREINEALNKTRKYGSTTLTKSEEEALGKAGVEGLTSAELIASHNKHNQKPKTSQVHWDTSEEPSSPRRPNIPVLTGQMQFLRKMKAEAAAKAKAEEAAKAKGQTFAPPLSASAAGAGGGNQPPVTQQPPVAGKETTDPAPSPTTHANKK